MKIIVWGINYAPEVTGIAPCNTALCEFLLAAGHEVQMLTSFAYYPEWKKRPEDLGRLYRTDTLRGVPVHRCWHYIPAKVSALRRILHEGSFVLASFLRALFLRRAEVYVVVSPPLLLGAAAWVLTRLKRSRYHFHVQDLQPDAALGLNMLQPGHFTRMLYQLEALAYAKAGKISGIGPGMIDAFRRKGVPENKIVLLPNGIDLAEADLPTTVDFREKYGYGADDLLAVYSGNLGVKQGLDVLLDVSRLLTDTRWRIVLCGAGARREHLAARIEAEFLANVRLFPLMDDADYRAMLHAADVCLITQQIGSGNAFLPSKLLPTLAHRRPVISVADGDSALALAVAEGGFGLNVLPATILPLANALRLLAVDRGELEAFGEAGRRYVERFDQKKVLAEFEAVLRDAG